MKSLVILSLGALLIIGGCASTPSNPDPLGTALDATGAIPGLTGVVLDIADPTPTLNSPEFDLHMQRILEQGSSQAQSETDRALQCNQFTEGEISRDERCVRFRIFKGSEPVYVWEPM